MDSHVISTVEQSTTEIADRRRVLAQSSRRVKRNEEDQALIHDLRNQLERSQEMADAKSNELANFHEVAEDMRRMQAVYRAQRVQQVNQMALRIRELEAAASRHGEEIARERDTNAIAQLLIAQYKAQEEEAAALEIREWNLRSHFARFTKDSDFFHHTLCA